MKRWMWIFGGLLPLLGFLGACHSRGASPDYNTVQQHAAQSHQDLNQEMTAPHGP